RVAVLRASVVVLVVVAGAFGGLGGETGGEAVPPAAMMPDSADPMERARLFLASAGNIAVRVDPQTLAMTKDDVRREDIHFFTTHMDPTNFSRGVRYQLMP